VSCRFASRGGSTAGGQGWLPTIRKNTMRGGGRATCSIPARGGDLDWREGAIETDGIPQRFSQGFGCLRAPCTLDLITQPTHLLLKLALPRPRRRSAPIPDQAALHAGLRELQDE
jgi:hypothetical protein